MNKPIYLAHTQPRAPSGRHVNISGTAMIIRPAHRFRIISIVAAITVAALIAASCGSDDATVTPAPVTETTTTVNQPTTTVEAVEEPLAVTTTTTTVVALTDDEVAEVQQAIAEEAAPESELTLDDCTAWVADPEIVLDDQQASECDAMLVAVAESCVGMDCPGDDSTEPEETETPVTTLPPQEEEPEPEPEPTTTTTATPEPEPEPEPEPVRLGDRFAWCAEVQAAFDEMTDDQAAMAAVTSHI